MPGGAQVTYIKVRWLHTSPDDPVLLYSELDAERWEQRKVDIFADGRTGFADAAEQSGDTATLLPLATATIPAKA